MGTGVQLGDVLRTGYNVAKTSIGHRFIGHISQPVFANLRDIELKKLQEDDEEKPKEQVVKTPLESITDFLKLNFTRGDLISVLGVALMGVMKYFSPTKEGREVGFIEKCFKNLALAMTFGGTTSSIIGRATELDLKTALGKDFTRAQLDHAHRQGIQIFKKYEQVDKEALKKEAETLDRILVYKDGVRESILERYARDEIGGLFDGPPGTGKTAGVICLLGKWAKRVEKEGSEAVIAQLNLAKFDEYLKERKRSRDEISELVQQVGAGDGLGGMLRSNEGLQILEMLVTEIQKLKTRVDKHNMLPGAKKQKLVVFVDEIDKVFDPATLQGCDKARLKNLLIQLNELFMKAEILLTSNRTLEQMIEVLKTQLYEDEHQDGSEVWKPMYDRFASKNRVIVDLPSPREQAEIIAGNLLSKYDYAIDWKDFGLQGASGNFELDRKLLASAIEADVTAKITRKINGRQLNYVCDDISGMLLGLARLLRLTNKSIPDNEWENLSSRDRILRTGAKINRQVIAQTIKHKIDNMKLDITEDHSFKPVKTNNGWVELFSKAADQLGKGLEQSNIKIDPVLVGNVINALTKSTAA